MAEEIGKVWKKFLKNHWQILVLAIAILIIAVIGAIYVLFWFVGEAQTIGLIPTLLGEVALSHLIFFILHLIFWEAVFIGIPLLVFFGILYGGWWKRLPAKERKEYRKAHLFGKRSKRSDAGGGFSFIIFIAFVIKIILDGNWNWPFAEWGINYLVYSWFIAFIWIAVICGIPMLIGGLWWLNREMNK